MPVTYEEIREKRRTILARNPDAKLVFYVTLENWADLHAGSGLPFDYSDPFRFWRTLMHARVVITDFTYFTEDTDDP